MSSVTTLETAFEFEMRDASTPALLTPARTVSELLPDDLNTSLEGSAGVSQQLEPTDKGPAAWRLLWATFVFEALLWGFPLSYGIFQNYYSQLPEFAGNPYIPIVGSIAQGISYLGAPVMAPLVKRFPKYLRHMIYLGLPLCILGLVAGSFANTLGGLIVTQGIMYGVGFLVFYYPIISMVNEWWIVRRGMAWGIIASASGVSGVVMPFVVEAMLNRFGYKTTLRAIAIALTVLTGPLLPQFKARLPVVEQGSLAKTNWSFINSSLFWVYCVSNVMQGLGFFFPSLYLPSYVTSVGLSATQGALLLALMSVMQVLGQFTFGYLSDGRVPINLLAILSTVVAAGTSLTLWGMGQSMAPLVVFSILYGFFAYGYVSMRMRMGSAISDDPTTSLATFSIFCFGQGVGNVLAGPISAGLLTQAASFGYGMVKYKPVVIFTGACMLLSALSIGTLYLRPRTISAV
ncbi:hypothetical protein BZG36_05508 [Bifiguratus adelaidae]|uniref:Major facilitator superfamily (MFS) profile domain-containing protein n=1 Tax=Bifiguratus adelaidae TaxID=1938954 RepID=A0A261XTH1_9FUNG|nr:hypothetical protein BZG36_05508 [Bifiguratus adelaidae]